MNSIVIFSAEYLYLFLVAALVIYFLAQPRSRQRSIAVLAVIFLPIAYGAAKLASLFFYSPRPFVSDAITPLIPHVADNGFPSDHILLVSAIAAILFVYDKK